MAETVTVRHKFPCGHERVKVWPRSTPAEVIADESCELHGGERND